ncbi:MAG: hypothetical protein JOZ41_12425 [Chloroflexi bacterium]|nr:hypothetical protein [Chloroflexota bacterium]
MDVAVGHLHLIVRLERRYAAQAATRDPVEAAEKAEMRYRQTEFQRAVERDRRRWEYEARRLGWYR